ncbi:MAG: serine hydrolase [Bacteroidetes bacterium]|nr:serine hydrolase [Bacteroidota bacterium]
MRTKPLPVRLLLFAWLLLPCTLFAQTPAFITDSLDTYVRKGMKDWQVPGLALVVIKDGKVVIAKGYGVKDVKTGEPVDENTPFMIASNTKLFTATALAQLEYDHKLALDDKVSKYIPYFKLYDSVASQLVSIRDILSHRIGTKTFQGDFTFWNSKLSREEIIRRIRLLKPSRPFRQTWGYCNSCFLTAGEIIPKVTGKAWEEYIQDSLLTPLEMTHTYTSLRLVPSSVKLPQPYTTAFTGDLRPVPLDHWDNLGPAADLISTVSDLSHWLQCQLDSGRWQGRRVVALPALMATRDINTMMTSRKSGQLPINFMGYGLGLVVSDYNGRQTYWHTGGAAGMVSVLTFVPDEHLGLAILTNQDNQEFFFLLRHQILDAYLGVPYKNRSEDGLRSFERVMKDTLATINSWKARVTGAKPPMPLSAYCGHYSNKVYGSMDIRQDGGRLVLRFNSHDKLTAKMEYMDNEEWLLEYDNIEYGIYTTKFGTKDGKVTGVETRQSDFVEYDGYSWTKE